MVDGNEEKIVFEDDTSSIISEILQKYNLEEGSDEVLEKLEKEEPLRAAIVLGLTEDITAGRQPKEEMASLLQERLTIPKQTAANLARDIETRLLPIARKATLEEVAEIEKEERMIEEETPFEEFSLNEEPTLMNSPFIRKPLTPADLDKKSTTSEELYPEIPQEPPKKEPPIKEPPSETPNRGSQDTYREPIG